MTIANNKEEVVVTKNARIGKNNYTHEFDIYYEVTKAGVRHRVAIECKTQILRLTKAGYRSLSLR